MVMVPRGISRKRDSTDVPPTRYKVYYQGEESDQKRVYLGWSERRERHLEHRFYPSDGSWPRVWKGHTAGCVWLLEVWRGAKARSDAVTVTEDEEVTEL
jgi:hypothetical protein